MPSKYQIISDLSAQTSVSVTSNTRRYLDFLRNSAPGERLKSLYLEQLSYGLTVLCIYSDSFSLIPQN